MLLSRLIRLVFPLQAIALVALLDLTPPAFAQADALPSWNDTSVKQAILDFVEKVTDESGQDFVPPKERIAVFDMDGTLVPEKPVPLALVPMLADIKEAVAKKPLLGERPAVAALLKGDEAALHAAGEQGIADLIAVATEGKSTEEIVEDVEPLLKKGAHPKFGVSYLEVSYQPMKELLALLAANGFQNWICSGSPVLITRELSDEMFGIPPQRVMGSNAGTKLDERDGKTVLVFDGTVDNFNDGAGKPVTINLALGLRPVFVGGNEGGRGDIAMMRWSKDRSGPSFQVLVNHDDGDREYAYSESDNYSLNAAQKYGFHVVSIKNDWKTVVGRSATEKKMTALTLAQEYEFRGGYPTPETTQKAFDEADLNRAVRAYRFFYPTVSNAAIWKENVRIGVEPNKRFGFLDTQPKHVGFTLNSDTPYGGMLLDLNVGPLVIEVPPGALLGAGLDINQRWIMDMGLPGPDAGKGGKHLLLPPGHTGEAPDGYFVGRSTSYRVIAGMRALPERGDVQGAINRLKTIKVYPLDPSAKWSEPTWFDQTPMPQNQTPTEWEGTFRFWETLHEIVSSEPPLADALTHYGDLAALGIAKGQPFAPDERTKGILEQAAKAGSAQMRVESLSDRRPDRVVWPDRQWQWAALRFENDKFDTPDYRDTYAAEKWFYQAIATSPAMFRRDPATGSLYWLGLRDKDGAYLDGSKTYKLSVPLPVPNRLFWSVTVYDAETRSQIQTEQAKAALRSLFELKDVSGEQTDLYFGPTAPAGQEGRWIQTIPGKGWFVYFRIYGPQPPAFDGSWKPGDFVMVQ
ncbi:DUF1214 domain-containing protein [Sinorhizobium medicae]|uniref:DUF1214 domain-containing protein n=1 Tax=Sinorhizobium medicae TaxID=110321 RepID=UPI000FD97F37|nr:DUF1214 domain-containing protein [Sinorhizobium medicae]RVJ84192.1 DUF1214 domain-containing protein [Sinorhizobium medicae]